MNATHEKTRAHSRRTWLKRAFLTVLAIAVGSGVVLAAIPKPLPVETASVSSAEFVVFVREDGQSRVRDRYVVSAPLTGNLARLEVRAGDEVKQGALLGRLLPLRAPLLDARTRTETVAGVDASSAGLHQSSAQLERAKAALDYARQEGERTRKLVASGAAGSQEAARAEMEERSRAAEYASAEFGRKVAQHELEMARSALGRFEALPAKESEQFPVTSPMTGRILKVLQQSEGVVQAGTALVEIGDPGALEVAVDVLTSDAVMIHHGAPVVLEDWGGPPLHGSVRLVEPSAFTRLSALGVEEQRVNAVIDLDGPNELWEKLGDGYRVEAKIEVYRNPKAVLLPWSALVRRGKGWGVFVVEGQQAHSKAVTIGRRNELHVEVLGGVVVGERVIVHPSDRVAEGVKVVP